MFIVRFEIVPTDILITDDTNAKSREVYLPFYFNCNLFMLNTIAFNVVLLI